MTAADTNVAHYRKESWRLLAQVDAELERGNLEAASQALRDAAVGPTIPLWIWATLRYVSSTTRAARLT